MTKLHNNKNVIFTLVIFALALGNAGSTLYLPALVQIGHALQASNHLIKLSLSVYLICFGLSQLIYGPLSDAFGRRINLLLGLLIFSIGTIISLCATHISMLLIGRAIEGLGIGTANAVGYAVMRDIYSGKRLVRQLSIISVFVGFIPLLAPLVGGYLTDYINWRACFGFLLILALTAIFMKIIILPETNVNPNLTAHHPRCAAKNYFSLIKNTGFISGALICGLGLSIVLSANAMLPFLMIKQLHINTALYGWLNVAVGIGYVCGAFAASRFADKCGFRYAIFFGICTIVISSLIGISLGIFWLNSAAIIIPGFFVLLGAGFLVPLGASYAIEPFPNKAGYASALMGAIVFSLASVFTAIASHFQEQTQVPLFSFVGIIAMLVLPLLYISTKNR